MEREAIKLRPKGEHVCPYCRDKLDSEAGALCATCLAVHHVECWREHMRCASCGHSRGLLPKGTEPVVIPEGGPPGMPITVTAMCDVEAACLLLGVHEPELRWLIAEGHIMVHRQGERDVFSRRDLARLLERLPAIRKEQREQAGKPKPRGGNPIAMVFSVAFFLGWSALLIGVGGPVGLGMVVFAAILMVAVRLQRR